MSGLHHAAPPSFFPTAKELSSGLQWFKEHPILAAAAAATVSVITYLHTANDDDVDADGTPRDLLMADDADPTTATTAMPRRRYASSPFMGSDMATTARVTSSPPPPALRKPGSEGKMSPAAVTWVDEHGGSLTQVFEHFLVHAHDDDVEYDSAYPNLDGPVRSRGGVLHTGNGSVRAPRAHGRPPTPRRKCSEDETGLHTDATTNAVSPHSSNTSSGHWMGPLGVQSLQSAAGMATPPAIGDRQTESPQWGWYVPITPPQDHLTGTVASLPRAVTVAPVPARSATHSAAAAAVAAVIHSESIDASSSLRRSASGRIKAA